MSVGLVVPHLLVAMSLNEGIRYHYLFKIDPGKAQEFRNHQKNCQMLLEEKKRRVSLAEELGRTGLLSADHMLKMIRYRPVCC